MWVYGFGVEGGLRFEHHKHGGLTPGEAATLGQRAKQYHKQLRTKEFNSVTSKVALENPDTHPHSHCVLYVCMMCTCMHAWIHGRMEGWMAGWLDG